MKNFLKWVGVGMLIAVGTVISLACLVIVIPVMWSAFVGSILPALGLLVGVSMLSLGVIFWDSKL